MFDDKSRYHLESVRVDEFFTEIVSLLGDLAERKRIALAATCNLPAMTQAYFDRQKIQRTLEILMSNVMNLTPDGGGVEFSAQIEDETLLFFFRVQAAASAGSGSAELDEARRIIERHGGNLRWQTPGAGGEIVLSFDLPLGELAFGC